MASRFSQITLCLGSRLSAMRQEEQASDELALLADKTTPVKDGEIPRSLRSSLIG